MPHDEESLFLLASDTYRRVELGFRWSRERREGRKEGKKVSSSRTKEEGGKRWKSRRDSRSIIFSGASPSGLLESASGGFEQDILGDSSEVGKVEGVEGRKGREERNRKRCQAHPNRIFPSIPLFSQTSAMDPSAISPLPGSLPYLPLETKHPILRFCAVSTLARTSQVSLAFLELSCPLLYRDIHLPGAKLLPLLFSERVSLCYPYQGFQISR